jgi:DNA-binding beta-propeller fold protein YncE
MRHCSTRLLLMFAIVMTLIAPGAPAQAQAEVTLTVNTLSDEWSTGANAAQSKCSLREALQATITNSPPGNQGCGPVGTGNFSTYTISLMPGTYVLTRPDELPNITKKIRINGNNSVKIDGNRSAGRFTGIFIVGGGELILEQLKLQHGRRPFGGALWIKSGIARAAKVEFYRNIAFSSTTVGDGGAVHLDTGDFYCLECRFIENKASGNGGAVRTGNTQVLIDKSEFLRNEAQFYGGAIAGFGGSAVTRPRILRSLFRANKVFRTNVPATWPGDYRYIDDVSGGGTIYNRGYMQIEQSQIIKSSTERSKGGGAIYNQGELLLLDVAIHGGQAIAGGPVPATLGGAIFNQGRINALRVSIHDNEATRGGGILNGLGGTFYLVNSTVAQNRAQAGAGFMNGYEFVLNSQNFSDTGGEAHLYLSTLVRNDDSSNLGNVVDYGTPGTVYMANSLTDGRCSGPIYTYGGNTFVLACDRTSADLNVDQSSSDKVVLTAGGLKLEGLTDNGGVRVPAGGFLSVKPKDDSPVIDLARNEFCTDLATDLLGAVDQVGTERPQGTLCDSGALEVGTNPPEWTAEPGEGAPLVFAVIFADQATTSTQTIEIGNKGGGKIKWEAQLTRNDGGVFGLLNDPPSGSLGKDDNETVTLSCAPSSDGTYYGALTFSIDQPEERKIVYNLVCSRREDTSEPVATAEQAPGAQSAGIAPPGDQSQVQIKFRNQGSKPLSANVSWANPGVNTLSVAPLGAVVVAAGSLLALTVTCAPDVPGLTSNSLQVATDDPLLPTLAYSFACEGAPAPDPAPVEQTSQSQEGTPRRIMGLALSPEGNQLLAGHWDDAGIARYSRGPSGLLALQGSFSVTGMSGITGIRYSSDGQNVYYTSRNGNGVVVATRDAGGLLTETQTITSGSKLRFCKVGDLFLSCPLGTMGGARALALSPDDLNVYVSGINDDSLTVFRRNPSDGKLAFTQAITGTLDGAALLDGIFGVLVSPDGKNVYVASQNSNAVVAFSRRPDNGTLRYLSHVALGEAAPGLGGATELAISPDGSFLYVAAIATDSVQILARSPDDGFLTPLQSVAVGVDPYHILLSHDPDGERLLVALWNGDAIMAYRRDRATGMLTPLADQASLTPNGPVFLVGTPDDRDVYAALFEGQGVQHIRTQRPVPVALSVAPVAVAAGTGAQTLSVRGHGFAPDSQVYWQGAPLATSFVSTTRLEAAVPAALIAIVGSASVLVRTPPGGGGDSSALTVTIQPADAPPSPAISSISPDASAYDGVPLSITISGSGFTPQSRVLLNGVVLASTYLNAQTLLAELSADDLSAPGPRALNVVNGDLGAAALAAVAPSAAVRFMVAAPGNLATPAISGFSPASLAAGSPEQWVTVRGRNFSRQPGALTVANWDGERRETVVLDAETLQVRLTAADLAAAGAPMVTLFTPGAGGSEARAFALLASGVNPVASPEVVVIELGATPRLVLSGEQFVDGAQILLNGTALSTTYDSEAVLRATVSLAQLRQGGTLRVANPNTALSNELLLTPLPATWLPLVRR